MTIIFSCGSMKIRPKLNFFSHYKSMKEGANLFYYLFIPSGWTVQSRCCFLGKTSKTLVRGLKISSILMDTTYYVILIFGSETSLWTTMSICWSVCTIFFANVYSLGKCRLLNPLPKNPCPCPYPYQPWLSHLI